MRVKCKVWIETDDGQPIISEGKYILLKDIEKTNSIKLSAHNLGLSYKRAHSQIKTIEKRLGQRVLERRKGVGSVLTQQGKDLLEMYELVLKDLKEVCGFQIHEVGR